LIFDLVVGQRIQAEIRASDLSLARAIATETELSLQGALRAVENLSEAPGVIAAKPAAMQPIFAAVSGARPDVNLVYRLNESGTMVYHYPAGPGSTVGQDFSFRDYFSRALVSTQPLLSSGRISPTTGQPVTTAVMPIRGDDGEFLGLVATNLQLESLSTTLREILSEHEVSEGLSILILDDLAQIIAHPNSDYLLGKGADLLPLPDERPEGSESGSQTAISPSGEEQLYTFASIPSAGWTVVVSRPTAAAFSQQVTIHRFTLAAFVTFALIGLLFWVFLSRRVIQPVEKLAHVSSEIGENNPILPAERAYLEQGATRSDQIGYLIASLLRMERSIDQRMNEQATLLETSQAVVSSLDTQVVLNRILEQVERLMHVDKVALVALDEEAGVFRARASRGLSRSYAEHIAISPDEPLSVTMRALRAGEPIRITDTETDPTFSALRPRARAEGYRSVLAVPLKTQHTPPSALLVYRPEPHIYTQGEIQLMVSFANHATMAIENAALFARSDMRLTEQTRRIESLIQSMQEGLVMGDLRGNVVYSNRRVSDLARLTHAELTGMPVRSVLDRIITQANNAGRVHHEAEQALRGESGSVEFTLPLDGKEVFLRMQTFDVTNPQGVPIGQGIILKDVTSDLELDRMKSSLISTVSHELRTPLAAIKGYATTLLAEDVQWDAQAQRDFLEIISAEVDRLTELVKDLLDLSRIEAGSLSLDRSPCQIEDLIERAAQRGHLQPGNRFEVSVEPGLPGLHADVPRLESILRNLIENAVKYAGAGARIRVSAAQQNGKIIFRVEDNGPGIPPEQASQIFRAFYRLDNRLSRASGGAGLGLAICQGFVRAHGGEIWAEPSERGACIAFSIPLTPEAA
jgi:PAS domain S-box-containing protein